jgi:Holliday junction resolvase RusA-like endonuclease
MNKINIKPLSVNAAWQGKRFKTKQYQVFESHLVYLLPRFEMPPSPYKISFVFGFSSPLSDLDNALKCTIDVLQKKYLFNDKEIFELRVKKEIVTKGNEFISFQIETLH